MVCQRKVCAARTSCPHLGPDQCSQRFTNGRIAITLPNANHYCWMRYVQPSARSNAAIAMAVEAPHTEFRPGVFCIRS